MIGRPDLSKLYSLHEEEYVNAFRQFIHEGIFIGGTSIDHFEAQLAMLLNKKYVVTCKSGTHALQLALKAAGIGIGDEVISVANTYYATIWSIWSVGAKIVFCDVNEKGLIDVQQAEKLITSHTKAILPVHLYGIPCDINNLISLCNKYDLFLIEDASHAFGGNFLKEYNTQISSEKRLICISLYPTKNLGAMGDGGIVATNCEAMNQKLKSLRYFAEHPLLGDFIESASHAQLDTLQAILMRVNLEYIQTWSKKRRKIALQYADAFKNRINYIPDIVKKGVIPYVFPIFHNNRNRLGDFLLDNGIFSQIHYNTNLHKLQWFSNDVNVCLPRTEWHNAHVLSLPVFPTLTPNEVDTICKTVIDFGQ